jgi:hypothetical protein
MPTKANRDVDTIIDNLEKSIVGGGYDALVLKDHQGRVFSCLGDMDGDQMEVRLGTSTHPVNKVVFSQVARHFSIWFKKRKKNNYYTLGSDDDEAPEGWGADWGSSYGP